MFLEIRPVSNIFVAGSGLLILVSLPLVLRFYFVCSFLRGGLRLVSGVICVGASVSFGLIHFFRGGVKI